MDDKRPASILIVNIRLIGDVILCTPLIGLLNKTYPEASIDLLVGKGTGEFLEKDPRVRKVIYSEKSGKGYLREVFRKYDLAINTNASDRGNIAVLLAGRSARVGFYQGCGFWRNAWKKLLFTHPLPFPFYPHVARIGQMVAEALDLRVERLEARVFWSQEDEDKVSSHLRDSGIEGPFFVIHPFARWDYKYWRMERFAEVSDQVAIRYGLHPVWTSSPDETEMKMLGQAEQYCSVKPLLIPGLFSLNQMTCLLSISSLYIGLDTAVSHLAATVGVPMVVLYGPTIAERWSPWNNDGPVAQQCPKPRGTQSVDRMILIQKDWECVPCGLSGCDDRGGESPCLAAVEVPEVLQAVEKVMDSGRREKGQ